MQGCILTASRMHGQCGITWQDLFIAPDDVIAHARAVKVRGAEIYKQWQVKFNEWEKANPQSAQLLNRLIN